MKLFQLLLLTCYIYGSFGAIIEGYGPVTDKRHIDNGYTCQLEDVLLTPGTHLNVEGQCNEYHCGEDSSVLLATCGSYQLNAGCELVDPPVKPYPGCCEDIKC